MKFNTRLAPALVALIASSIGANASYAQNSAAASDALRAADSAWEHAYAAKNLDKAVSFFDDQGSMLAPNAPIAVGKAALTKMVAGDFALGDISWQVNHVTVARSGELGYTTGTYAFRIKNASGKFFIDKGKYLTVWTRPPGGAWKVLVDTFNSDLPPGAS